MISTFTAFLDANVLYGARLRSLVLFLAQTKLFRARWSDRVHDEWIGNLLQNRPDLKPADLARTRQMMDESVLDALVTGYAPLVDAMVLPDPDDRHVLAAAVVCKAGCTPCTPTTFCSISRASIHRPSPTRFAKT